ncbi:MAG: sigma-54-dependent Fis family transcriptional regulator [Thermoanaerobaculia bacterium]|nr:sigma-54-dependent Fis family transcriptional regulator [Thermoanaerobaculia bacterium]
MKSRLLVVDDEQSLLEFLRLLFEKDGYEVRLAGSVEQARRAIGREGFDLVLCDVMMPDGNGLDLLREIKQELPHAAVIMMTAYTSTRSAIEAMKLGAFNYVSKPFDVEELRVVVARALDETGLVAENVYLRRELEQKYQFANIIGRSSKMREIFSVIDRVAKTQSTVLIRGESGTGKELIARAIHFASPRGQHRFLSINCGALPENLLESELFGHEKGAFTGAVRDKKGLFQEADHGTLFLDEIGEMTPAMQVKLLRALQERRVRRVGGNLEEGVDVRIIAATNQNLQERIASGEFREDLFYRINVIPIELPPLRNRREDVPLLVEHFVKKFSAEMAIENRPVSKEALRHLEEYDWPGNVRELENTIERALALATSETLTPRDLPRHIVSRESKPTEAVVLPEDGLDLERYLDEIRAQMMSQALERCHGVQTQAAELIGMTFRSFRYYAKKLKLAGHGADD